MTDHTPGPWAIRRTRVGNPNVYAVNGKVYQGGGGDSICTPTWTGKIIRENIEEIDANALLIAAAPDLLEALKNWERLFTAYSVKQDYVKGRIDAATEQTRKAIAKATGSDID